MTYAPPPREKPLVLVVDDDLSLRLAMGAALIKAGFAIIEAENGRQALDLFLTRQPELVCLDVMMPEMDGFETCAAIRKAPGGLYTQILMVTGLDDTESIERAFEVGANDFVAKPINWSMLGHRGRYMLRAGHAFQEVDRSKRRLAKTQELAKIGNWEFDYNRNTFYCSTEACEVPGLSEAGSPITYKDFLRPIMVQEYDKVKGVLDSSIKAGSLFPSITGPFQKTEPGSIS